MRWLGQAQRAFDLMCERANTRVAFGSPLADKQQVQQMIFDTAAEIQACRLLTLDAAHKIDQGDPARVEIGIIKVVGAQMLHNAIDRAIQVHGAKGVSADTPLERMYRHARFARIYDGPDEVHRVSVARLILRAYKKGEALGLRAALTHAGPRARAGTSADPSCRSRPRLVVNLRATYGWVIVSPWKPPHSRRSPQLVLPRRTGSTCTFTPGMKFQVMSKGGVIS